MSDCHCRNIQASIRVSIAAWAGAGSPLHGMHAREQLEFPMLDSAQESAEFPPLPQVISVAELNRIARNLLERQLPLMWVAGEISNCKRYESGHCYFTLKDADAQVDCVMFRNKAQLLGWLPQDGMQVEVRACPTLYEARGKFQLTVETMRRSGLGALYEAFAKLKVKLEREGLFDAARRRPLPRFPRVIGIVTSPQAAALRDVLTTLRRRMPGLQAVVYPTPVQGGGAARSIAAAIAHGERARGMRCADRVPGRRQHRGPVGVQRGSRGARDSRQRDSGRDRHRPRNGLHHRRFCRRFPRADADRRQPSASAPTAGDLVRLLAQAAARLRRCRRARRWRTGCSASTTCRAGSRIPASASAISSPSSGISRAGCAARMRHGLENDAWRARDLGQRLVAARAGPGSTRRRERGAGPPPAARRTTPPRDRGSGSVGSGRPPQAPEPAARARPGLQHHGNRRGSDRARRLQARSRRRGADHLREGLGRRGGQTSGKSRGLARACEHTMNTQLK